MGFILGMCSWFNMQKSINIIYSIIKMKDKTTDAEEAFENIQTRNTKSLLSLRKNMKIKYDNPTTDIIPSGEDKCVHFTYFHSILYGIL
jgi:hypothetical protein